MNKQKGEWEFVGWQNGISVYKNTLTWEIDVVDMYSTED